MEDVTVIGVYREVDDAAQGIQNALKADFASGDIDVITGVPYPDEVWGLPPTRSNLRKIAALGWVGGAMTGFILAAGTAWLYPLPTAGKPIVSLATAGVIVYEFAMLFGVFATALFTLRECKLPNYGKLPYHPKITEGWPAVTVFCRNGTGIEQAQSALKSAGAQEVLHHAH